MSLINSPYYNELAKIHGPFYATMQIAKNAREIAKSLEYRISDSEALSYAANGMTPNPKDYPDKRLNRVKQYISYIDDEEVRLAILDSYEQSLKKYYLIYDYKSIGDEPRRSRIRIILNILWDTRPNK
jgi:hypothetical protein